VVYELVQQKSEVTGEVRSTLKARYELGDQTISDIIEELKKPNRDPREDFPKPIMQQGVLSFEDLREGMKVTGKIKNVVDFGAFVDIGIKETALLHLSEMSDQFVRDPMDVVKVGDVKECRIIGLDMDRRRISLSCKSESSARSAQPASSGARRVVVRSGAPGAKSAGSAGGASGGRGAPDRGSYGGRPQSGNRGASSGKNSFGGSRDDDGMTYNPFADLLKGKK